MLNDLSKAGEWFLNQQDAGIRNKEYKEVRRRFHYFVKTKCQVDLEKYGAVIVMVDQEETELPQVICPYCEGAYPCNNNCMNDGMGINFSFKNLQNSWRNGRILRMPKFLGDSAFGQMEIIFRAWHDMMHCRTNLGFSYLDEFALHMITIEGRPEDFRLLLASWVLLPIAASLHLKRFVKPGRKFTPNLCPQFEHVIY